jgi:HAD superfamily hydrolase (TIGR01549 family)
MPIRAVVFDLGNTLWFQAREPDLDRCFELEAALVAPLLERWGIGYDRPLSRVGREVWPAAEQWFREEARRGGLREADLPAIIRDAAVRHGIALTPEQAVEWWRASWIGVVDLGFQLYPDAIDVLRELRRMGIKVGVNSNRPCTGEMQMPGLREIGVGEYVDTVVCSGDTGYMKPHRSTFDLVLARLGTRAADTMMVGDSCAADITGAKATGMIAVLKLNGRYGVEVCDLPDYVIHDLGELLALPPFGAPEHQAAYAVESLTPHDDENAQRY